MFSISSLLMIYWFLSKWFISLLLGSLRESQASKHFKYGFSLAGIYEPFEAEADILWWLQKDK